MMDYRWAVQRLEAYNTAHGQPWRAIGMAADAAELEATQRLVAPACYVIPGSDTYRDSSDMQCIRQMHVATVGVLIIARSYRVNAIDADELNALRTHVRDALLGAMPPGAIQSLRHAKGQLLRYTQELMVYADEFTTEYHIRRFPQ